jgi:rhodanese-related sulfurtransferase/predicted nucleotidyltransferase
MAVARADVLKELCLQFKVDILYVFGSRAAEVQDWLEETGTDLTPGPADVDIGIKAARGVTLSVNDKVHLALALEDLLDVTRVDLVCLAEADPFLAANIVRGERLYASDTYQADEYELYVLRRAGDLAPLERERMALILGEDPSSGEEEMGLLDIVKNMLGRPVSEPIEPPVRTPVVEPEPVSVVEVSAQELIAERRAGKSLLLLDCREPFEWRQVRIPGSLHIPMNSIPYRLAELDKAADIVVICAHGNRSYDVAGFLSDRGFAARSLQDGITEWHIQGGEVESDYGR